MSPHQTRVYVAHVYYLQRVSSGSFVQDPIARAEAAYILNADAQFAVPKNGDIVRGLIQDFCLAGCLLTCRDTLLDIHQFQNLVSPQAQLLDFT